MAPRNTPANTPATAELIPVRLNLVMHVDPAKWAVDAAPAVTVDRDKLLKALKAQGLDETAAAAMADAAAKAQPKADGNTAVRASVRAHLLALLAADPKVKAAGMTVADADRTPKA